VTSLLPGGKADLAIWSSLCSPTQAQQASCTFPVSCGFAFSGPEQLLKSGRGISNNSVQGAGCDGGRGITTRAQQEHLFSFLLHLIHADDTRGTTGSPRAPSQECVCMCTHIHAPQPGKMFWREDSSLLRGRYTCPGVGTLPCQFY
jgi:hypothetical protein